MEQLFVMVLIKQMMRNEKYFYASNSILGLLYSGS